MMKINRLFLSLAAVAFMLTGCYEMKMEWDLPEGHYPVSSSELPLTAEEGLANYQAIKVYAAQYMPGVKIGAGIGADLYMNEPIYYKRVNDNFQVVTLGNEMKNQSVVRNNGSMNFNTIDSFLRLLPSDVAVYGHNFIWHTQQQQMYYKSLIGPEIVIVPDSDDPMANMITNSSFDQNDEGWNSWSHHTREITDDAYSGSGALKLSVDATSSNQWDDQLFWTFNDVLTPGKTYVVSYWAKTDTPGAKVQFLGQSSDYSQQIYMSNNELTGSWMQYTDEFTLEDANDAIIRVGAQFGGLEAVIYIDDFKFGEKVEKVPSDPMLNVVTNYSFDENDEGWNSWSHHTREISSDAYKGSGALKLSVDASSSNQWDDQLFWALNGTLEPGKTYMVSYWARTDTPGAKIQFLGQSSDYSQQIYASNNELTSTWIEYTDEFTLEEANDAIIRIGAQFGGMEAVIYVDEFKFGEKIEEAPSDPMINIVTNFSYDENDEGWNSWSHHTREVTDQSYSGAGALKLSVDASSSNSWDDQLFWTMNDVLVPGKTYMVSYWARTDTPGAKIQFLGQSSDYSQQIYGTTNELTATWLQYTEEFTLAEGNDAIIRIGAQFGGLEAVVYVDEFKFGEKLPDTGSSAGSGSSSGSKISYIIKTPEQKKAVLLSAMEEWIKGMAEHVGDRVYAWDVINEPISDNGKLRGIEGGWLEGDSEPVEDPVTGSINLNWGDGHWYWGYYCGFDYAVKAFEFARQYSPKALLFVNDYNLETNAGKLDKLIEFVKAIDAASADGKALVDGIGTQMHVYAVNKTLDDVPAMRAQFDAMFKKLAATGKIVRVTELDVAIGTDAVTSDMLAVQAAVFKAVFESYKANVPAAQQDGITIWGISDNKAEHAYWLTGDHPNLWDESFARKPAYKAVCDAIAGKDLQEEMDGDDWQSAYEDEEVPDIPGGN